MIAEVILMLTANTTDNKVSIQEARATEVGITRVHLLDQIGPVDEFKVNDHTYTYRMYRPRYMWEVHYRGDMPLRYRWSAVVHCPVRCLL